MICIVYGFISGVFKSSSRHLFPLILESLGCVVVAAVRDLYSGSVRLNFLKWMVANIIHNITQLFRNWSVYSFGANQVLKQEIWNVGNSGKNFLNCSCLTYLFDWLKLVCCWIGRGVCIVLGKTVSPARFQVSLLTLNELIVLLLPK